MGTQYKFNDNRAQLMARISVFCPVVLKRQSNKRTLMRKNRVDEAENNKMFFVFLRPTIGYDVSNLSFFWANFILIIRLFRFTRLWLCNLVSIDMFVFFSLGN